MLLFVVAVVAAVVVVAAAAVVAAAVVVVVVVVIVIVAAACSESSDDLFVCLSSRSQASRVGEEVARWEEAKKWQHKVETLRAKLAEKSQELEKAEKTIAMLREAVNRADRDRAGLQNRLKG